MNEPTDIDLLEADNNQRLVDLMQGKHGLPVQFPPGSLDTMRVGMYVEVLLEDRGILDRAREKYQSALAEQLDEIEVKAREARLTQGTGTFTP